MDRARFDEMYAIMEDSFPTDEHRPRQAQQALFDDDRYAVYTLAENGRILGFLAVWTLENWLFIEHFAVSPDARNRGIGGNMLQALLASTDLRVCLEVELPESDIARRRIGFYTRQGLTFNDHPYVQPAMGEGQSPVPLRIMTSNGAIDCSEFRALRALLYRNVYRVEA